MMMKKFEAAITGLLAALAMCASADLAQAARARPAPRPPPPPIGCCNVPDGAMIEVELAEPLSTKTQKTGDTFGLRLAAPLIVDGIVVLRAGTPGVGEIVDLTRPGMGGKPGRMVLAARYLTVGARHIPLQSLHMRAVGKDNTRTATAAGAGGLAFAPLGLVGLAVAGGHVELPVGTTATARIAQGGFLQAVSRASPREMAAAQEWRAAQTMADSTQLAIPIPPPPPGRGQVVFFRRHTLMGTAQWFNIRENGQALGKLSNGAYFVQVTEPGRHTYTAATELRDTLTLQVDPGETYFVEGTLTKGIVMGEAAIAPSTPDVFNDAAAKDMRLAPPPAAGDSDDQLNDVDDNAPASTAPAPTDSRGDHDSHGGGHH